MRRMRWTRHSHHSAPAPAAAPVPMTTSDITTARALEHGQRHFDPALAQLVHQPRHDAGGVEVPHLLAALTAGLLVAEDLLQERRAAFHAGDLRDHLDAPHAVVAAAHVHDEVQRRADLLADGA